MKRTNSRHTILAFALALTAINIGLFVVGIQWAQGVMSELSESSEDQAVAKAAGEVDQVFTMVMSTLEGAAWVALVLGGLLLLVLGKIQWEKATRAEKTAEIRSYTRNLARAKGHRRRRHERGMSSAYPIYSKKP